MTDIQIEFLSAGLMSGMETKQKVDYIIDHVKADKILVIGEGMSPIEETALIEETMNQINQKFSGIEVSTLREKTDNGIKDRLIKLLGGRSGGLTVIGPSKIVREMKRDPTHITMYAGDNPKKKKKQD